MDHEDRSKHIESIDWISRYDPEELVGILMDKYGSELKKLAFSFVKDWGKAEDITQEVFFACYRKINDFKGDSSVKTWLIRITVNRCKDVMKSWSFRNILVGWPKMLFERESLSSTPEHQAIRRDEDERLAENVIALPLKYREVIMLYYYSELKTEEIAQTIGQNARTVRTRLRRGRSLLRKMYEEADSHGK